MSNMNQLIENELLKVAFVLNEHSPSNVKEALVYLNNDNRLMLSIFDKEVVYLSDFLQNNYNMVLDEASFIIGARGHPYFFGNTYISISGEGVYALSEMPIEDKESIFASVFPIDAKEYGIMCKPSFFDSSDKNQLKDNINQNFGAEKFLLVRVFHNTNELYDRAISQSDISVIPVGKEYKYNRLNIFDILPDEQVHPLHRIVVNKLIMNNIKSNELLNAHKIIDDLNEKSKQFAVKLLDENPNSEIETLNKECKKNRQNVLDGLKLNSPKIEI